MKDAAKRIERERKTLLVTELVPQKGVVAGPEPLNLSIGTVVQPFIPAGRLMITDSKGLEAGNASVEEILVQNNSCNEASIMAWRVEVFYALRVLTIGRRCLSHLKELVLCNMPKLEKVTIGSQSVAGSTGGRLLIDNCAMLKLVEVGAGSFASYAELCITNCSLLESVELKDGSFAVCKQVLFQSGGSSCC